MRFLGLGLTGPVPDANTVWTFREALKKANAIDTLFRRFDEALRASGYLAMAGQIIDAVGFRTKSPTLAVEVRAFQHLSGHRRRSLSTPSGPRHRSRLAGLLSPSTNGTPASRTAAARAIGREIKVGAAASGR
jgi:Transposase domain (DUF772)